MGVTMILVAGFFLSLAGITLRHMESASGWQILFFRSISFFVVVALLLVAKYRGKVLAAFMAVGWRGIVIALALGFGSVSYIYALLLTTVANALFIISAAPLMTAASAWLFLRERLSPLTWFAMSLAVLGIGVMVYDGIGGGRAMGNLVAFGTPVAYAIMLVVLRQAKDVDMLPATCLAGVVGAATAWLMADNLDISQHDLALCVFLGTVQYAGGFVLITIGSRYVAAAEVALLSLSESIVAPIWVWIGVNEVPSPLTLVGGAIVLVAVVWQALAGIREERMANAAAAGRPAEPAREGEC